MEFIQANGIDGGLGLVGIWVGGELVENSTVWFGKDREELKCGKKPC